MNKKFVWLNLLAGMIIAFWNAAAISLGLEGLAKMPTILMGIGTAVIIFSSIIIAIRLLFYHEIT